jgi:hypothetical protein
LFGTDIEGLCMSGEDADAPRQQEVPKGRFQVEIDMKFAIKSIVAAAAFVAVGVASAASVSVVADGVTKSGIAPNQFTVTGSGTLQFSKNLASALTLGQ